MFPLPAGSASTCLFEKRGYAIEGIFLEERDASLEERDASWLSCYSFIFLPITDMPSLIRLLVLCYPNYHC